MNNLRRMHMIAGSLAILCIVGNLPKIVEAFKIDWQNGISLLSTLAIGGYLLGCAMGAIVNLFIGWIRKK